MRTALNTGACEPNGLKVQSAYLVALGTEALHFQRFSLAARARAQDCRHGRRAVD